MARLLIMIALKPARLTLLLPNGRRFMLAISGAAVNGSRRG